MLRLAQNRFSNGRPSSAASSCAAVIARQSLTERPVTRSVSIEQQAIVTPQPSASYLARSTTPLATRQCSRTRGAPPGQRGLACHAGRLERPAVAGRLEMVHQGLRVPRHGVARSGRIHGSLPRDIWNAGGGFFRDCGKSLLDGLTAAAPRAPRPGRPRNCPTSRLSTSFGRSQQNSEKKGGRDSYIPVGDTRRFAQCPALSGCPFRGPSFGCGLKLHLVVPAMSWPQTN